MIRAPVIAMLMLTSCTMSTDHCDVSLEDLNETRAEVARQYPDAIDVFDRMDVYCVDDTDTVDTCGTAGYEHTEACTMWLGSGPYRGKVFLDLSADDFDDLIMHEAQHWYLMELNGDDGCPTHEAACGWKD